MDKYTKLVYFTGHNGRAVALPHTKPCPICAQGVHVDGLCPSAQAYANQDFVSQWATPSAPRLPNEGEDDSASHHHGYGRGTPEVRWPYTEREHNRLERNRRRRQQEIQAAVERRAEVRAERRREWEWDQVPRPPGVDEMAWEALRLRTVYRDRNGRVPSFGFLAHILGYKSRQAVEYAIKRAEKRRTAFAR